MKGFAKNVENLFFPSNVAIAGAFVLVIYFHNSPFAINNIAIVSSSILTYYILRRLTAHKIKSETKKFSTAASISLLLLVFLSIIFPVTREVFIGALAIAIANFFTHFARDKFMLSSHMMAFSAVLTILIWVDSIFVIGIPLLLLIAWSRLALKRHTYEQVLIGTLVGFVFSILVILASSLI